MTIEPDVISSSAPPILIPRSSEWGGSTGQWRGDETAQKIAMGQNGFWADRGKKKDGRTITCDRVKNRYYLPKNK